MTGSYKEAKIEQLVCRYAESLGWLQYKFASPNVRGVPDRIFFRKGICICIEFKRSPKMKASLLQMHVLEELDKQGIRGYVCGAVDDGKAIFDEYENAGWICTMCGRRKRAR